MGAATGTAEKEESDRTIDILEKVVETKDRIIEKLKF